VEPRKEEEEEEGQIDTSFSQNKLCVILSYLYVTSIL
jgi:hypothetical protein